MFDRAFSSFAVPDNDAAKEFYGGTLGLDVKDDPMGFFGFEMGGHRVFIYTKDDFTPATYTVLNFEVDDIDAAVDALADKGISLERYEGFEQDDKGIMRDPAGGPAIAWFNDPFGNVLSVVSG